MEEVKNMNDIEVRVLLPGIRSKWSCGGLFVAMKFATLLNKLVPTTIWTYIDNEDNVPFLEPKTIPEDENIIWIVTWGPHVNNLLNLLKGRKIIYFAQSFGWKISVQPTIPILCGSRFIMANWTQKAPYNPIYLYKHVLDEDCKNLELARDIDVLVFERKSSNYINNILIPELQKHCSIHIVKKFIPFKEVLQLYNRSKVLLYSFTQVSGIKIEGFGLQPLEAMVCGCTVFSSLVGGLSDYLDPCICGYKLKSFSKEYDVKRILQAVHLHNSYNLKENILKTNYSEKVFYERMKLIWPQIVEDLNYKFNCKSLSFLNIYKYISRKLIILPRIFSRARSNGTFKGFSFAIDQVAESLKKRACALIS